MGNTQGIQIEDVKAKFATCEIEEIEKSFQKLAKEGSFRGKTFDKKTFVRLHFPNAQELGSCIFEAMNRAKDGKVTEEEFFFALSLIIRGAAKDKFKFIFMMISFSCGTGQQRISSIELHKFLTMNFFQPKGMNRKAFEQKVKENVIGYFKSYDKDNDKFFNLNEFYDFAENSFEVTILLDIFLTLEKKFTTSSSTAISGPTGVVHETHVERTEGGGISIDNIPGDWLQLFREAGIKKRELSDPKTAMMLMEIVAKKISEKTQNTANEQPPAANASTSNPSLSVPPPANDRNNRKTVVNTPAVSSPPAPSSNAVAPPPPPPPPPPAPSSNAVAPPPPPANHPAPVLANNSGPSAEGGLLSQIRQGTKLRPTEIAVEKLTKEERNDITSALVDAIKSHRVNMNEEDDEEDDGADDWDD